MSKVFVTGNGTFVGKTVVSAVLVRALGADYWKPLQSGNLDDLDSANVHRLAALPTAKIFSERHRLLSPLSPHAAAAIDGVTITRGDFELPQTNRPLVVEGCGGLLVPLGDGFLLSDLIKDFGLPAVVVARHYLGSINHTLLTLEGLAARGIPVVGIVFVGDENRATETAIRDFGQVPILGRCEEVEEVTAAAVARWADAIAPALELRLQTMGVEVCGPLKPGESTNSATSSRSV